MTQYSASAATDQRTTEGASELPVLSETQERVVRALAVLSLIVGCYWIWWRWTATLNPDAMFFSVALVTAETWGLIASFMFVANAWKLTRREPPPAPPGRTVDVFITVYDEPIEVVRRTAIGARAIRYPHRTYILDDGKRDDLRALTEELGIGYIRRVGNANAKAGNLNHAIGVTSGEFILQLDADHVPLPNIIHRMLGYFEDPQVAFIQSPQDFYNTDSFTHVVNEQARSLWEENRIFYSLLQPGKDYYGGSFFCGSCGMLRRAALETIGGFSTNTIIEDMETSLVLHGRGWKSVYHAEALAFGLSPGSASAFHVQRLRWAQGSMQLMRKMNPLTWPGLTAGQRMTYAAACLYPLDGVQKLIFYLSPVIFLFTGLVPLRADTSELLMRLVPYLVLTIGSFELLARGTGLILISERYNMAKFPTYILATLTLFTNRKLKFNVTPKGVTDVPFKTYAPQLALLVVSVLALFWAPLAYRYGWVFYPVPDFQVAIWGSIVWVLWNIYFAAYVVRLSLRVQQQRSDHRFADEAPVRVMVPGSNGSIAVHHALTNDLNPTGLSFRSAAQLEPGTMVEMDLPLSTRSVRVRGEVVHVEEEQTRYGRLHLHGMRFDELPVQDRDAIEMHCTHHALPMYRQRYHQAIDWFTRANSRMNDSRGARRHAVQL
ncbi:MAG TPA: glycosyltransferase, partial [Longimicrobiales bacterium]